MIFFALMALMINTCVSYGYMISTVSSNMAVALASGPAALGVLMIFSGFFEFGRYYDTAFIIILYAEFTPFPETSIDD